MLKDMSMTETFKVAIVGCGKVGMTTAYALLLAGIPTELVLHSRECDKAYGEKLDLEHGQPFLPTATITATNNYADLAGSDVVIVTAGAAQKPGQTRLDLAATNVAIINEMVPLIVRHAPEAIIILVSNPVDVLTYKAFLSAGLPFGRVFGSGTLLDTARFRFHLSEFLRVNPRSIHAYILGEHGDSSFPVIHGATIGGQPLTSFPDFSEDKARQAYQATRDAAARIIAGKGATYYGIATALSHLTRIIARDEHSVLPLSVPLTTEYYGEKDLALSVPCIVGRNGIERVLTIDLSEEEQQRWHESAGTIRSFL